VLHLLSSGLILADAGTAFTELAKKLAEYLPGFLTLMLVVAGYTYISTLDDIQQATRMKKMLGAFVLGGILIQTAVTFGPQLATIFSK